MARDGSGNYNLAAGNPVVSGTTITDTWANTTLTDIAAALTASIAKDGQTTATANIPMGTFKLTGLGAGSADTDSANFLQLKTSWGQWFLGNTSRDMTTASGDQAITGVGFQPRMVECFAVMTGTNNVSYGMYSNASTKHLNIYTDATGAWGVGTGLGGSGSIVFYLNTGGTAQGAYLKSLDADGFTLGWTKTGSPTGTFTICYRAWR